MICELSRNAATQCAHFYIDSADEKANLPTLTKQGRSGQYNINTCVAGSTASCKDGTKYILTGEGTWEQYSSASGGGGGDTNTYVPISDSDIQSLFSE